MGLDVGEIGFGRDLRLDLKMFAARSLGRFAAAAAADLESSPATAMVSCIKSLEEERVKIEVFKRELPLCGRLLTDVIEVLKEEAGKGKSDKSEDEQRAAEDDGDDKRKWMSTAQLWVDNCSHGDDNRSHGDAGSEKQSFSAEAQSCRPGFGPFKTVGHGAPAFAPPCLRREEKTGVAGLPDLSLLSPQSAHMQAAIASTDRDDRRMVVGSGFAGAPAMWAPPITSPYPTFALQPPQLPQPQPQPQHEPQPQQEPQPQGQQQGRKARRCWSPELHRQFVAALHQLGGAQVATPKQIRELMKVDGLTNDEVKSHLQKYRLHNRRAPGSAVVNQPIVLVGGLWLSQEQSSSQSGSPQGPLQFSTSGVAVSSAGTTVSCEEEDGRSESYGWK